MSVMPSTVVGKWGFWLSLAFALLFALKVIFPIPIPSMIIFGVGIAGLILNIIAVIKKERALFFFIVGGLIGAFVIFWVGGELLFPH